MAKQIIFFLFIVVLFSCNSNERQDLPGSEYIGNWHMEQIKNPKYPYYVYDYSITKNGKGFTVKIHVTCPKCKDQVSEEITSIFSGNYNEEKNVFEIQKEGFQEVLTIPEMETYMISSRFPKYIFTKIK